MQGRLRVDEESRTVTWRATAAELWRRGITFAVAGVALPAGLLADGADEPSWLTVPVLLVVLAAAAWLVGALRAGWEIDDTGLRLDTGHRRPERIDWTELEALRVDADPGGGARLVAERRDGRVAVVEDAAPERALRGAVAAVQELGLAAPHVTVAGARRGA